MLKMPYFRVFESKEELVSKNASFRGYNCKKNNDFLAGKTLHSLIPTFLGTETRTTDACFFHMESIIAKLKTGRQ